MLDTAFPKWRRGNKTPPIHSEQQSYCCVRSHNSTRNGRPNLPYSISPTPKPTVLPKIIRRRKTIVQTRLDVIATQVGLVHLRVKRTPYANAIQRKLGSCCWIPPARCRGEDNKMPTIRSEQQSYRYIRESKHSLAAFLLQRSRVDEPRSIGERKRL